MRLDWEGSRLVAGLDGWPAGWRKLQGPRYERVHQVLSVLDRGAACSRSRVFLSYLLYIHTVNRRIIIILKPTFVRQ